MQSLAPGSPEYKVKDDEVTALTAKLEAEKGKAQRDFGRKEAESMSEIYKKVQDMVRACAQRYGMTYVVRVSNEPGGRRSNSESLYRDAIARTVVYSDPKTDITKMVTFNLNDRYHKQNPNVRVPQPPGPTAGNPGQAQDGARGPGLGDLRRPRPPARRPCRTHQGPLSHPTPAFGRRSNERSPAGPERTGSPPAGHRPRRRTRALSSSRPQRNGPGPATERAEIERRPPQSRKIARPMPTTARRQAARSPERPRSGASAS